MYSSKMHYMPSIFCIKFPTIRKTHCRDRCRCHWREIFLDRCSRCRQSFSWITVSLLAISVGIVRVCIIQFRQVPLWKCLHHQPPHKCSWLSFRRKKMSMNMMKMVNSLRSVEIFLLSPSLHFKNLTFSSLTSAYSLARSLTNITHHK